MKIKLLPLFVFLFVSISLKAQGPSIIVLKVIGQIEYQKDQSTAAEILLPGMKIFSTGTLNLQDGAIVNLLCNGKQTQVAQAGVFKLSSLSQNDKNSLKVSFGTRFWNFVSSGLSQSDDKESLNEYSEKVLAVTGGVQGFALEESPWQTIMPADGNIGADIVTFKWYHVENATSYHFKIYLSEKDELVFKAITRDTSITLDFSQLVFHPKADYEWQIEAEQEKNSDNNEPELLKTDAKTFEYFPNAREIIVQKAEKIEDYKKADEFEKQWIEAIVMEQENFNYDAFVRYSYLRSQYPDNLLIKKLFAAFLVRQGLTQQALEQMD